MDSWYRVEICGRNYWNMTELENPATYAGTE